jgi:8-oxo-dGTP pyrophosphatase MutT (NUDIX family)
MHLELFPFPVKKNKMKRGLLIRNVTSHDIPLDSLDNACVQVFTQQGFLTEVSCAVEQEIMQQLMRKPSTGSSSLTNTFEAVIFRTSGLPPQRLYPIIKMIRTISKQVFLCIFSAQLIEYPMGRYQCFQEGASMVTNSLQDMKQVMHFIASCDQTSKYTCPFCQKNGLTEDQLWKHTPLYHINETNAFGTSTSSSTSSSSSTTISEVTCPICRERIKGQPFQVHLHNAHGPPGRGEMHSEFHMKESSLYAFALVVCHNKKYNHFLLVQEFANSGFWLPGGRIDNGENPIEAAIRETKEEAGIDIQIKGLIRIEYHPKKDTRHEKEYVRMRFILYAEPIDPEQIPKSIPDYESVGATWCQVEQIESLPLRGPEPIKYFQYVASGQPIYPMSMLNTSNHTQNNKILR